MVVDNEKIVIEDKDFNNVDRFEFNTVPVMQFDDDDNPLFYRLFIYLYYKDGRIKCINLCSSESTAEIKQIINIIITLFK